MKSLIDFGEVMEGFTEVSFDLHLNGVRHVPNRQRV